MTLLLFAAALLFGIGLVLWGLYLFFAPKSQPNFNEGTVAVSGRIFSVAVADTAVKRAQGLSGVPKMEVDEGMYFMFPIPATYSFWMKDMQFPLDIVWIRDNRIVSISENVPAPTSSNTFSLPTYTPEAAVDRVLEIGAGLSSRYGFSKGQEIAVSVADGK